jgi:hypothetical protein
LKAYLSPHPRICAFSLAAGFLFLGCAAWETKPGSPGITSLDYKESCGTCHAPPKPKSRTDEEWKTYVMDHRFVTGQDEETAQLFVDYLKARN